MSYLIKWLYSDLAEGKVPADANDFEIHFRFLIRFPDVPPGRGHVAHFVFNVIPPKIASERGINAGNSRSYIVAESFSYRAVIEHVENAIAAAFANGTRQQAIEALDKRFAYTDRDYGEEFQADVPDRQELLSMVGRAFDGVARGSGVTLHEAALNDEHWVLTPEQTEVARAADTDRRWQDVPDKDIRDHPSYISFLDDEGYKYYLPANLSFVLRHEKNGRGDIMHSVCFSLLAQVDPRHDGKGLGKKFDVDALIKRYRLSKDQIRAIYQFLRFATARDRYGLDEDDYYALLAWWRASGLMT